MKIQLIMHYCRCVIIYRSGNLPSIFGFVDDHLPYNDIVVIVSGDASLETACYILKERYISLDIRYIAKLSDVFQ
jgi:hypothetical protein